MATCHLPLRPGNNSFVAEGIDADLVLDYKTGRWIKFNSRSDALLAYLRLQKGVSLHVMKLVLDVLSDQAFDLSGISFKDSSEIDLQAWKQQEAEIERRRVGCDSGMMPSLILEMVVGLKAEELSNLNEDGVQAINTAHIDSQEDLLAMSLVHSSWAHVCRKPLLRRATIRSTVELSSFTRSAFCTSQLVDFHFEADKDDETAKFYDGWFLLTGVLKLATQLRQLSICFSPCKSDHEGVLGMITELGSLRNLQRLHLGSKRLVIPYLDHICKVLPNLTSLTHISINGWSESQWRDDSEWSTPPPSLVSLKIRHSTLRLINERVSGSYPEKSINWLSTPQKKFALKQLCLDGTWQDIAECLKERSDSLCSSLSTLEWIVSHYYPEWLRSDALPPSLSSFNSLTRIHFVGLMCKTLGFRDLRLPSSLEVLQLSPFLWCPHTRTWTGSSAPEWEIKSLDEDETLAHILQQNRLPSLRLIELAILYDPDDFNDKIITTKSDNGRESIYSYSWADGSPFLPQTMQFCRESGIRFVCVDVVTSFAI